jgi:hypothetical protein
MEKITHIWFWIEKIPTFLKKIAVLSLFCVTWFWGRKEKAGKFRKQQVRLPVAS